MALRTGPTGQVVALEPDPVARARCELHVSMNKLGSVRIYGEAASSATGSIGFVDDSDAGSTTGHVSKDPSAGVPIPCVRLDDLYSRDGLRNPDFIKIDVENHGAEALAGATTLLAGRPAIMMSFHSEHELAGTEAILGSLGYRVVSLTGQSITWAQALYKTAILNASGG
jgi:FkbM family methyltransferase